MFFFTALWSMLCRVYTDNRLHIHLRGKKMQMLANYCPRLKFDPSMFSTTFTGLSERSTRASFTHPPHQVAEWGLIPPRHQPTPTTSTSGLRSCHHDKNTFILSPVALVTLIMGCGRAHGTAEFRNDHIDVGQRRSGTPSDEQGLSYTHTPLPGACVCVYEELAQIPQRHVCMPALLW